MIKAVFLDMDDTLIVNEILFEHARTLLFGYLRNFGILPEESQKVFADKDKELFKTYGRSPQRYPAVSEAVLKHFVPQADAEMVSIVRDLAGTVFTTIADVKPGVTEAIDMLGQGFPLYIVTAGDKDVQEFRLRHLPFRGKISDVFIVDHKDKSTYETVVKQLGLKPSEAIMIGDSLKSDIFPAVEAGLQAVWIETNNSKLHEGMEGFPDKGAYKFSSLLEVARMLLQKGRLAAPYAPPKDLSLKRKFG
jgi:putative hydrolase of the HAD superfamily